MLKSCQKSNTTGKSRHALNRSFLVAFFSSVRYKNGTQTTEKPPILNNSNIDYQEVTIGKTDPSGPAPATREEGVTL